MRPAARGGLYAQTESDERVGKSDVSGTRLATSKRGKVIIKMPDVMDELSKPKNSLSAEPPVAAPRRSPVWFIVFGMLVLALVAGTGASFDFRDSESCHD